MSVRRPIACLTLFTVAIASIAPAAKAGPLLDWLFGYRTAARPAYPVGPPVPVGNAANMPGYAANRPVAGYPVGGYAGNYGNYYGSMMPVVGPVATVIQPFNRQASLPLPHRPSCPMFQTIEPANIERR